MTLHTLLRLNDHATSQVPLGNLDLRIQENRDLLAQDCLRMADYALIHTHQMADYLRHARNSPYYSRRLVKTPCQHINGNQDGMEITRYLHDTGVR